MLKIINFNSQMWPELAHGGGSDIIGIDAIIKIRTIDGRYADSMATLEKKHLSIGNIYHFFGGRLPIHPALIACTEY